MATTLSLRSLLDNDKLMGPNFDSWYQKLKIILEHKWILYVVTDPTEGTRSRVSGLDLETFSRLYSGRLK